MVGLAHRFDAHVFEETGRRGCGPGCVLVTSACACGFGRRLRILDGKIVGVEVQLRASWQWFDPLELLAAVPYVLCPECGGAGNCPYCRGLGLMEAVPPRNGVPSDGVPVMA